MKSGRELFVAPGVGKIYGYANICLKSTDIYISLFYHG